MSSGIPLYVGSSQLGGMTLPLSANPWAIALNEAITISSVLSFVLFWIADGYSPDFLCEEIRKNYILVSFEYTFSIFS